MKRKRKRRRIVVSGVDSQWAVDLADVQNLIKFNDGIKYLLIVVDVFSKLLFVQTLMDKKASTVLKAFQKILDSGGRFPDVVFSDKGGELNNALFKRELAKRNIKYFTTQNEDIKTSVAERVIRTLKTKLYRLFQKQGSYRYVEHLQNVVDGYNKSKHSSLKNLAPKDVSKTNEAVIWVSMYNAKPNVQPKLSFGRTKNTKTFKFKVNDFVRLSYVRYTFQRDYHQKWTTELFKISERFVKENFPLYKVVDLLDAPVIGTFYEFEMMKIKKPFEFFKVESILKTRIRNRKKRVFD